MINKVRHAVMSYNDSNYLLTDVQKFYESTGCNVVLKILSKTIKDGTTMTILKKTLEASVDHWVKEAYLVWEQEMTACPIYLSVKSERNGLYFDEYHMTNIQITDELVNKFNIDLSKM